MRRTRGAYQTVGSRGSGPFRTLDQIRRALGANQMVREMQRPLRVFTIGAVVLAAIGATALVPTARAVRQDGQNQSGDLATAVKA